MTYRKLSRIILIASTLVLGGLWVLSLRTYYSAFFSTPAGGVAVDLHHATVGIFHFPMHHSWNLYAQSIPDAERVAAPENPAGPMGKFDMGTFQNPAPGGPPDRYVHFPVWCPFLVLTGGLLVLARMMKRRSNAGKEQELALTNASVDGAVDND